MRIAIVNAAPIPALLYGGTERVIWDLGRELVAMGHHVTYVVPPGSRCDFAPVVHLDMSQDLASQIPQGTDVVHSQFRVHGPLEQPCLVTEHGNPTSPLPPDQNTVFVSRNHAERHGSSHFVLNGLNWAPYGPVDWEQGRNGFHFLGKAAWRVKNVRGAIDVALRAHQTLDVLGGDRFQWKRGLRFTWSRHVRFHGMVGGQTKNQLLNRSRGLVFPVRWHEPFGLAVVESLYFGCPVFATPYGSLPELVPEGMGVLSDSADTLADALTRLRVDPRALHAHVCQHFNATRMAQDYLRLYERLLDGERLLAQPTPVSTKHGDLPWNT